MPAAQADASLSSTAPPAPKEGRVQLALNVDDLVSAIEFYSKLFGTQPAKVREGYANFAIHTPPLKLVLIEKPGHSGTINHLGVEVASQEKVRSEIARLTDEGLFTEEEIGTTCCFAKQDKVWVQSPEGERWEVYTVLADSAVFGTGPADSGADACCGSSVEGADNDAQRLEKACC